MSTIKELKDLNPYTWIFSNYITDKHLQIIQHRYTIKSILPTINIVDVFSTNSLSERDFNVNPIHGDRYLSIEVLPSGFDQFFTDLPKLDFLIEGQTLIGHNTYDLGNLDHASIVEISRKENKYTILVKKIRVKPDFNSGIPIFGTYIEV